MFKDAYGHDLEYWAKKYFSGIPSMIEEYIEGAESVRILRFERLNDDFNQLMTDIGQQSIELPRFNATESKTEPYQAYYNKRSRKVVEDALIGDLNKYGYQFE
jgi:hypothetical protein